MKMPASYSWKVRNQKMDMTFDIRWTKMAAGCLLRRHLWQFRQLCRITAQGAQVLQLNTTTRPISHAEHSLMGFVPILVWWTKRGGVDPQTRSFGQVQWFHLEGPRSGEPVRMVEPCLIIKGYLYILYELLRRISAIEPYH